MFKAGDKVYHIEYGWGIIQEITGTQALVKYTRENLIKDQIVEEYYERVLYLYLLSFTEYTLQGFSQERPIELPEVGELCLVRDSDAETWKVRSFLFESGGAFYIKARCGATDGYKQMKRIKILD